MKPPNIYISTPCHSGKVDINYHSSMMMTMKFLGENRIQHMFNYAVSTGVDAARSKHATEFLNTNCTHLMMIDDDMVWSPDLIWRLVEQDVDIIGVPYRKKTVEPIRFTVTHKDKPSIKSDAPYVIEVDGIATGMMLVKREVIEKLQPLVPAIQYNKDGPFTYMFFLHELVEDPSIGGKTYMSEDYNFCRLSRNAGFKVWAYVDEELGHMGTVAYRGDYATILERTSTDKFRDPRHKMPIRFIGDAVEEVYELPLECVVDGTRKMISSHGYKMPKGLLIAYSSMPDRASADVSVYLETVKNLYETEESDKGLLVMGRKVAA